MKILWADTETTGLDHKYHAIIQLSGLVELDGELIDSINIFINPCERAIDPVALRVNQRTEQEIRQFPDIRKALLEFKKVIGDYVDPYDRNDKFFLAGYNIGFDELFIREFFTRCGDRYYGSWFHWPCIDVQTLVAIASARGIIPRLENFKLATICKFAGIPINAHDALSDITATRQLCLWIMEKLNVSWIATA